MWTSVWQATHLTLVCSATVSVANYTPHPGPQCDCQCHKLHTLPWAAVRLSVSQTTHPTLGLSVTVRVTNYTPRPGLQCDCQCHKLHTLPWAAVQLSVSQTTQKCPGLFHPTYNAIPLDKNKEIINKIDNHNLKKILLFQINYTTQLCCTKIGPQAEQRRRRWRKKEDLDGRVFCPSCCPKRTGVKDR